MKNKIMTAAIVTAASALGTIVALVFTGKDKKKEDPKPAEQVVEEKKQEPQPQQHIPKEVLEAAEKINKFIAPKAEEPQIPQFTVQPINK